MSRATKGMLFKSTICFKHQKSNESTTYLYYKHLHARVNFRCTDYTTSFKSHENKMPLIRYSTKRNKVANLTVFSLGIHLYGLSKTTISTMHMTT